jgi:hypothetical protein
MFSRSFLWLLLFISIVVPRVSAANSADVPNQNAMQLMGKSGYVFAGTVTAIRRISAGTSAVDSVEITFHVDRAIRGVRSGKSLTIREWSGLWTSGERYSIGQRVVLFLYKPSKLGLTSPVGGSSGRVNVDRQGTVRIPAEWEAGASKASTTQNQIHRRTVQEFTRILRRSAEE